MNQFTLQLLQDSTMVIHLTILIVGMVITLIVIQLGEVTLKV